MKPFITITGADERTDLAKLAELDAEIGLLFTLTPEGRNRYPRPEWICRASHCLPRASLHVCGRAARRALVDGWVPVTRFQRIQVNGHLDHHELVELCSIYPRHTIITQHSAGSAHLLANELPNHAVLVDGSGGRGISPEQWERPDADSGKAVGFAGGLGPDNITAELQKIRAVAQGEWWADMEGKLRIDDWFSIDLAAQCVAAFHESLS